jgi:undecaprenyl-diphosphatase
MQAEPMNPDSPAVVSAVQWLAAHALPAFGGVLVLLLLVTSAVWLSLSRYSLRQAESRFSPLSYLLAYLLAGFALIAGAAALFAEIAENLGDGRKLGQLDLLFSNALQVHVTRPTLQVFASLTHMGDPLTLAAIGSAVALVLLWQRHFLLCATWALAVVGNGLLNPALKSIFARARPLHEHGLAAASGFSFPSGHASGSVVAYGMLAYVLVRLLPAPWSAARLPVVLAAAAIACTVGSSRVFLQLHFASDVLAGFASGAAWLGVCIAAAELARYRRARRMGLAR